jgi:hypothetical protein
MSRLLKMRIWQRRGILNIRRKQFFALLIQGMGISGMRIRVIHACFSSERWLACAILGWLLVFSKENIL